MENHYGCAMCLTGGQGTRLLEEVDVPIMSNNQCKYYLGSSAVFDSNICAGYSQGGKDACQVSIMCAR